MRFLVLKWWASFGGLQKHDRLGPPFSSISGFHTLTFIHTWTLSGHAAAVLERRAVAVAADPSKLHKVLTRASLKLLLLCMAIYNAALHAAADATVLIKTMPRTLRACLWVLRSGLKYKRFMARHSDHSSEEYQEQLLELHTHCATELVAVCRSNGGVYVKFGQFAVSFGAVPREYRAVLAQLEDKATPRPFSEVRKLLLSELGCKPSGLVGKPGSGAVFTEFEEKATAAASLAQVHRGRLESGEEVAVKLQYPGLRGEVRADLCIMRLITSLAAAAFPEFSMCSLYNELKDKLKIELDFRNEIHNANKLRAFLSGSGAAACVPFIHDHLSTRRMIIMEWIQGVKITDACELQRQAINPRAVGTALVKLFAELTFIHGYVHGDPHPGNLMVRATGTRSLLHRIFHGTRQRFEIVLLDHGTYLTLSTQLREQFCQLWCSFVTRDKKVQAQVCNALAGERAGKVLPMMLTHQVRNRREELALQQSAGINGVGDMTKILSSAPRDLVELLRINTVIRASSSMLGINMVERKRISAWFARRGLPPRGRSEAHIHPSNGSVLYHARLLLMLSAWTGWCCAQDTVCYTWQAVLGVFGDVLFED